MDPVEEATWQNIEDELMEAPVQQEGWEEICEVLRSMVGDVEYGRWFQGATWVGEEDGVGTVMVQGEMHQVWIETNHMSALSLAANKIFPDLHEVRLTVSGAKPKEVAPSKAGRTLKEHRDEAQDAEALEQRIKAAGLNPIHTFDSFVVGANSQFAHAACEAVAKKNGIRYNPLFIHGGPGLGKTHLMQAIGQEILRRKPNARVIYMTCEKFINEFIDVVRGGNLTKFRKRYRSADVLLIDDVQFLAGKDRSQEEFFHTFNALMDGRNQVVLTSDRPASEIKNLEPRLISRFECGLTVEMQVPQMETRLAILRKKSIDWKVRIDESVLGYLADKIRTNVRRLEGALMRVASFASLAGESVSVEKVEHLLRDLVREESSRQVTIDAIQKTVAEHFDVRLADMTSRRRPASIALPRQIAMYLSRSMTKGSLMEIGDAFGGRDHGTVIHACKKIAERIENESDIREMVGRIESELKR